jgi:hypothetical protein
VTGTSRLRYKSDMEETREGYVLSLPGYGGSLMLPGSGETVELFDEENNRCLAVVVRVDDDGLIYTKPNWDTWTEANKIIVDGRPVEDLMEALRQSIQAAQAARLGTSEESEETEGRAQSVG